MQTDEHSTPHASAADAQATRPNDANKSLACTCPRCDGDLIRIRRRPIDRLFSLFVPVRRFRCVVLGCNWEGNLRNDRYIAGSSPVTAF